MYEQVSTNIICVCVYVCMCVCVCVCVCVLCVCVCVCVCVCDVVVHSGTNDYSDTNYDKQLVTLTHLSSHISSFRN